MKKILFCIIAAMLSTASIAQEGRPQNRERREFNPENFARMQTERINKAVQLDSIQYQAVFLINYADALTMQDSMKVRRERAEKMKAEGKKPERTQPGSEEFKAQMELEKQRREARDAQMKQILTPEQYEKYTKHNEESRKRFGKGEGRRPRGERMGRPRE